jgi:hypothetical protein
VDREIGVIQPEEYGWTNLVRGDVEVLVIIGETFHIALFEASGKK